nr:MAG TPA: hypothetical protein [Caudoviricetes sp.]
MLSFLVQGLKQKFLFGLEDKPSNRKIGMI